MKLPALSPADLKRIQLQAQAERERRIREGTWEGGLIAYPQYQDDPIAFAVERLGIQRETLVWSEAHECYRDHEWDGTPDPIVAIVQALVDNKDVGCEAATGVGKSHALGWAQLWFLASWRGARCFSFASKEEQLDIYSWTEIKKLWPLFERMFPTADLTSLRIRMAGQGETGDVAGWGAIGRSAGVGAEEEIASKAAGMHAPHMLILVEEAQGVAKAVSEAIENTITGVHNLRAYVGNPDNQHDTLHEFCTSPGVVHVRISALDHPNVVVNNHRDPEWEDLANDVEIVPGAVSRIRILRREQKYGKGSRIYESRVRGISPSESEDSLIRWEWCEAAAKRWDDPEFRNGPLALGVDVSDKPTGDKSAFARWQGACLTEVWSFVPEDASEVGRMAYREIVDPQNPIDPKCVGVDSVGVGASTVNELKRLGLRVRHISGGSRAIPGLDTDTLWADTEKDIDGRVRPTGPTVIEAERFVDLRSQVWWRMREDLRLGRIALPKDEELWSDLTAPNYGTRVGKIFVEPKKDIKKRIGRSPDKGDAACYGNFVRRRTPVRTTIKPNLDTTTNVDRGLERLLARREKERKAEHRRMMGLLKRRVGARR